MIAVWTSKEFGLFSLNYDISEKKNDPDESEASESRSVWFTHGRFQNSKVTPMESDLPTQNKGHVKFETPKIPVIFVLGTW